MTLRDKIQYGYITFKEFSTLIDENVKNAAELGLRIWWQISSKGIIGRMSDNGTIIFEKSYTGEHLHIMLAKMHFSWSLILQKRIELKRQEEYRQRMIEKEALGGQNHEVIDDYDKMPTLGKKYGIT